MNHIILAFCGMDSAFNNFYLAEFVIDNVWYAANEHYMHSEKAALFDGGEAH